MTRGVINRQVDASAPGTVGVSFGTRRARYRWLATKEWNIHAHRIRWEAHARTRAWDWW